MYLYYTIHCTVLHVLHWGCMYICMYIHVHTCTYMCTHTCIIYIDGEIQLTFWNILKNGIRTSTLTFIEPLKAKEENQAVHVHVLHVKYVHVYIYKLLSDSSAEMLEGCSHNLVFLGSQNWINILWVQQVHYPVFMSTEPSL